MSAAYEDIEIVGLDLDQTLYPKSPLIDEAIQGYLYRQIAKDLGCNLEEAELAFTSRYKQGSGMSGSQALRDLGIPNAGTLVQEALEQAEISEFLQPDDELIHKLGIMIDRYTSVDVITGSNNNNARKKLIATGLNSLHFGVVLTADDAAKSNGDAFKLWTSRRPQVPNSRRLYVGDRVKTDHEVPSSQGIATALVYVSQPKPEVDCPQYPDLHHLLDQLIA